MGRELAALVNQLHDHGINRRQFLVRATALGAGRRTLAAIIAALGTGQVGMARSIALAQDATPGANQGSSADVAVEAAKQFAGETINLSWEAGLQALDPLNISGPLWEELTGVKINVIQVPGGGEHYAKQIAEFQAGTKAFDVIWFYPAWTADYVNAGMLEPLDTFVDQYMDPTEFEDYPPVFRDIALFEGTRYGLLDDGDVHLLFYRNDIIDDPANQKEFEDAYGYPLEIPEGGPQTWQQMLDFSKFFTDKYAPDMYGTSVPRGPGHNNFWFMAHYRINGGEFFELDTMKPLFNGEIGLKTIQEMRDLNEYMPPGYATFSYLEPFNDFLAGRAVMVPMWPNLGRWAENYFESEAPEGVVIESVVAGKVGYSLPWGNYTEQAAGVNLGVSSQSPRKELAYLFLQWMVSPEISEKRVSADFTLRDPYRKSHIESETYRGLWPAAGEYLDALELGWERALYDFHFLSAQEYMDVLDRACTSVWAGDDPQESLNRAAAEMEEITDRVGRDRQIQFYQNWMSLPGCCLR